MRNNYCGDPFSKFELSYFLSCVSDLQACGKQVVQDHRSTDLICFPYFFSGEQIYFFPGNMLKAECKKMCFKGKHFLFV